MHAYSATAKNQYQRTNFDYLRFQSLREIFVHDLMIALGDETLAFDHLVLTTGSTPRYLPAAIGGTLDGVYLDNTHNTTFH